MWRQQLGEMIVGWMLFLLAVEIALIALGSAGIHFEIVEWSRQQCISPFPLEIESSSKQPLGVGGRRAFLTNNKKGWNLLLTSCWLFSRCALAFSLTSKGAASCSAQCTSE